MGQTATCFYLQDMKIRCSEIVSKSALVNAYLRRSSYVAFIYKYTRDSHDVSKAAYL